MTRGFKILPELKALIPPLTPEEFSQLEQNCIADGIREKLIVARFPDTETGEAIEALADGHNRLVIAEKNNIPYNIDIRPFDSQAAVEIWMIDNQLGQRNLTDGWKWELAQARRKILKKKGEQKKKEEGKKARNKQLGVLSQCDKTLKPPPTPHNTREQVAKQLGWSTGKVAQATRIWAAAEENGVAAAIKTKVLNGEKTIRSAYDEIKEIEKKGSGVVEQLKSQENNEIIKAPLVCAFDENMFHRSAVCSPTRFGDKVFSLEDDKWFVLAGGNRFFHRDTLREFTLREYAAVQAFPETYKFVGSHSSIKKQIGNAVSPHMGAYVTRRLKGKTVGDVFAGCGGFTCGAHMNGMKTLWAIEWAEDAATSYKMNFPDAEVHFANIEGIDPKSLKKVDVIIGGPPCQGFSSANPVNKTVKTNFPFIEDPRNSLYKEFVRFVKEIQPMEFIMENVKEIGEAAPEIIRDFEAIGYNVETELVCGNKIGMKQNRERFFFFGSKL